MPTSVQSAIDFLFTALGAIVAVGGGAAAIGYGLFRFLGEKWLNAKFEERLALYKHEQQKELENLKFKINALIDRTTKLHQREFDVIPQAWSKLFYSFKSVEAFTASMQSYADLDSMTQEQVEDFLKKSDIPDYRKTEILRLESKNNEYQQARFWETCNKCIEQCRESHIYIRSNAIFMPINMKDKFERIDEIVYQALREYKYNEAHKLISKMREKLKVFLNEGIDLLAQLESEIQERLWSAQKLSE